MIGLILVLALGVVDLNIASADQLSSLPGIGKKKAEAVIAFRARHPFRRAQEIMRVRGIGPRLYARLRPHISVGEFSRAAGDSMRAVVEPATPLTPARSP